VVDGSTEQVGEARTLVLGVGAGQAGNLQPGGGRLSEQAAGSNDHRMASGFGLVVVAVASPLEPG
jgi:hypothetical protein